MQTEIFDKHRRSYYIKVPPPELDFIRLNIYQKTWWGRQHFAGYVNLVSKSSNALGLADLILEPRYRNRGLGTAVLQFIFALAQSRGVERIEGQIVGKDLRETPHLADWYRSHGFALEEIGPDQPMNTKSYPCSVIHERRLAQQYPSLQRDTQTIYVITKSLTDE